jgi:hypothetical protein
VPQHAAKALIYAILSWRDDQTFLVRGQFRGFDILSKGKGGGFGLAPEDERVPELFSRGRATYSANLNPANPIWTVQSIEHTLQSLDKLPIRTRGPHPTFRKKQLSDYQSQPDRPFRT